MIRLQKSCCTLATLLLIGMMVAARPALAEAKVVALPPVQPSIFDDDVRNLPEPEPFPTGLLPGELRPMEDEGSELPPLPGDPEFPAKRQTQSPSGLRQADPTPVFLAPAPAALASFPGMGEADFGGPVVPPDASGAVGTSYYVQFLNAENGGTVGIYRKSDGTRVAQFYYASLFAATPTGTQCDTTSPTDPQVTYDSAADRFILMDVTISAPFKYCIAVARTGDPVTGGWNLYAVDGGSSFPDYPKAGIWPDGYYIGAQAGSSTGQSGATAVAINKDEMEAGLPTHVQTFRLASIKVSGAETVLRPDPSTYNVRTGRPPPGAPNYFNTIWFDNVFRLYKFHVDWANPANSTFTGPTNVPLNAWTILGTTVASTDNPLDTLREHTTNASKYTNLGGIESLWQVHGVANPNATSIGALDWMQITNPAGVPAKAQQAVFGAGGVPDNTISRIQAGLGVDRLGNMLLAYTATSSSVNPGVRYAGRLANDPVNTLGQTEATLVPGGGGFGGTCGGRCTRWGDYSTMDLDPTDGCTLWFTNEYVAGAGSEWSTRIGAVALPGCASCLGAASGAPCDDGRPCTLADQCTNGTCAGTPNPCSASDSCHVAGTCNPSTGACANPAAPDGTACSDGDASTCGDSCVTGVCSGVSVQQPAPINDSVRLSKTPDDTTIAWTDPPGGYKAYRGSEAMGSSWSYNQTCLDAMANGSTTTDAQNPPVGTFSYYLVTRTSQCRESTLGFDSHGVERPNTSSCP